MRTISEQEADRAFEQAPQPVQQFLVEGEWVPVITELAAAHGLHVDQTGTLSEMNRNMLLGLISPTDFLEGLVAMGIAKQDAQTIIGEINSQIFIPLQTKLRESGVAPNAVPQKNLNPAPSYGSQPRISRPTPNSPPQGTTQMPPAYQQPAPPPMPQAYAPQPAPSYAAPAPLPPRSVMPNASPSAMPGTIYAPVLQAPPEQPQAAPMQMAYPAPAPVAAPIYGTDQAPPAWAQPQQFEAAPMPVAQRPVYAPAPPQQFGQPPMYAQQQASAPAQAPWSPPAQMDIPYQSAPSAPPANLPGMYGPAPTFANTYNDGQQPQPAPVAMPQPQVVRPEPLSQQPRQVAAAALPYVPQRAPAHPHAPLEQPLAERGAPAASAESSANTDPYREPLE